MSLVELFLSVFIIALAIPGPWLQLHRVGKERTSEGLSVSYVALGAVSATNWLVYGIVSHETLQIIVNTSGTLSLLLILGLMCRFDRQLRSVLYFVLGSMAVVVVVGFLFGPNVPGTFGTLLGFSCRLPQVYKSWREPGGIAVSVPNFMLTAASASGWLVFGLIHGDAFVLVSSSSTVLTSLYIVMRTRRADEEVALSSAVA